MQHKWIQGLQYVLILTVSAIRQLGAFSSPEPPFHYVSTFKKLGGSGNENELGDDTQQSGYFGFYSGYNLMVGWRGQHCNLEGPEEGHFTMG